MISRLCLQLVILSFFQFFELIIAALSASFVFLMQFHIFMFFSNFKWVSESLCHPNVIHKSQQPFKGMLAFLCFKRDVKPRTERVPSMTRTSFFHFHTWQASIFYQDINEWESGNLCDSKHSFLLSKEFICSLLANSLLKFKSIPLGKQEASKHGTVPRVTWEHGRTLPKPFQRCVKLDERRCHRWSVKPDIMWGCHGDQTLDSGQGHCAPFCRLEQALAYPIAALLVRTEDAVRTQTFHGGDHAIYRRSQQTTQHCNTGLQKGGMSGCLFGPFKSGGIAELSTDCQLVQFLIR